MKNRLIGAIVIGLLLVMLGMMLPLSTQADTGTMPAVTNQWKPWSDSGGSSAPLSSSFKYNLGIVGPSSSSTQQYPGTINPYYPPSTPYQNYSGITGPVYSGGSGMSFVMYFEDKNFTRTATINESQLPFYILVDTPPGTNLSYAWCLSYFPPAQQVVQWVFSNQVLSSGTQRLGPFGRLPGDPNGSYAFRISLVSRDMSGRWFSSEQVAYVTLGTVEPPPKVVNPIITSFNVDKTTVKAGGSVTVTWSIQDATSASLNGVPVNPVAGSKTFDNVNDPMTFTLAANNANAAAQPWTASVSVEPFNWWLWILIAMLVAAAAVIGVILSRQKRAQTLMPSYAGTTSPGATTTVAGGRKTVVGGQQTTTVARAKLVLPDGSEVPIGSGSSWIGRRDMERILTPQDREFLSRQHAIFTCESGKYYVEDQGSANGTKVNGIEIKGTGKKELKDGDSVQFANVATVRFVTL